jgi:hypothetical protein
MTQKRPTLDQNTRRAINEEAVRLFFSTWDPAWRWVLILGLRDMRANLPRLGLLAHSETGNDEWEKESYVYGPLALGVTAAAVNETAQHCEDLFALLKFLRERTEFVKRMTSYSAGQVTNFGRSLADASDSDIRKCFLIPDPERVKEGMSKADDPQAQIDVIEQGVTRLVSLTRNVVGWYLTYEFFHVQYKHGLKLPFRPFGGGQLPSETIKERQETVIGHLLAFTNENLAAMLARPPEQRAIMVPNAGGATTAHLAQLIQERALLRYQMSGPPVDLDDVVGISRTVTRLLRIGAANRISVSDGLDNDSQQTVQLPGERDNETVQATLELAKPVTLAEFT